MLNAPAQHDVESAVQLYAMCKEFRALPRPGGVLDQDSYDAWLLQTVSLAVTEAQELELKRSESKSRKFR